MSLVFLLFLAVLLCGAHNETNPTASVPPENVTTTELPSNQTTLPITNATQQTTVKPNETTTDTATTHTATTTQATSLTSPAPTGSEDGGLSSGAIAGITIGSIAGVAAVGECNEASLALVKSLFQQLCYSSINKGTRQIW